MQLVNEFRASLKGFLRHDKRRMDCLIKLIIALLTYHSVNLKKLACVFHGKASTDSNYRRLQRFFSTFRFDYLALAKMLFSLFDFDKGQHYLILDRTNWKWGQSDINILFLCIAWKKIAIPIFWLVLNKKGNSSTRERIALVQRFIDVFGKHSILALLGDREFIGEHWFEYLKQQNIIFYFRVKKDAKTTNSQGKEISIKELFCHLSLHQRRTFFKAKKVYGHKLFITGMPIDKDYVIIVSNHSVAEEKDFQALEVYAKRWEIETLFGCLKTKGFCFESTHIVHRERIKKWVAVLAIAFCWSHLIGEWRHEYEKPIPVKKHGRPSLSLFRYGLDWITTALHQRGSKLKAFVNLIKDILRSAAENSCSARTA